MTGSLKNLQRHEDWPERLAAYVREQAQIGFVWGASDCGFLFGNWVLAMTGVDPIPKYRRSPGGTGVYTTDKGCARALKRRDGTLDALLTSRFGPAVSWTRARRGDVVMVETDDLLGGVLGLCLGAESVFRCLDEHLTYIPTEEISAAWRVGE